MKKILLLMLLFSLTIYAQDDKKNVSLLGDKAETKNFYKALIPASINGSNIDPSPYSNITSDFSESKLSLKIGFPFKKQENITDSRHTFFAKATVKATNGVATVWGADVKPVEYGISGGYSYIFSHNKWYRLKNGKLDLSDQTSETLWWFNVRGNIDWANYIVLNEGGGYNTLKNEFNDNNGHFFVSFNHYLHSELRSKKLWQHIFSFGMGYAKTNNYGTLSSRTYEEGFNVYNPDPENATKYQSIVKEYSGRSGAFEIYEGFTGFGEYYFPIFTRDKTGVTNWNVYWGNRYIYYGIGKSKYTMNGNSGIYFNVKDKDRKDVVNFSFAGQFDKLNDLDTYAYLKKNLSLSIQASIPFKL